MFISSKGAAPAHIPRPPVKDWQHMGYQAVLKWAWGALKYWLWTLADALPPYRMVEGLLEAKNTDLRGRCYVSVGSVRVEVDRATFDMLVMGESLRVRYTRGQRAINIDRLLPRRGPG